MKIAQLNSATQLEWESTEHFKRRTYFLVADNYDFVSNSATDVTSIEQLNYFFKMKRISFNIYRKSVKFHYENTLSSNFSNLNSNEKIIISELFLESYANRNTVHSDEEINFLSKEFSKQLLENKNEQIIEDLSTSIATASNISEINNNISNNVSTDIISINGLTGSNISLDSDNITEGSTNLYYSDSRSRNSLTAQNGINYNSDFGSFSVADNYETYTYQGTDLDTDPGTFNGVNCSISADGILYDRFVFKTFGGANNDKTAIHLNSTLPSNFIPGEDIYIDVVWTTSSISGNVNWYVGLTKRNSNSFSDDTTTEYKNFIASAPATSNWEMKKFTTFFSSTNMLPNDSYAVIIYRAGNDGNDTMNSDAYIHTVSIRVKTNGLNI